MSAFQPHNPNDRSIDLSHTDISTGESLARGDRARLEQAIRLLVSMCNYLNLEIDHSKLPAILFDDNLPKSSPGRYNFKKNAIILRRDCDGSVYGEEIMHWLHVTHSGATPLLTTEHHEGVEFVGFLGREIARRAATLSDQLELFPARSFIGSDETASFRNMKFDAWTMEAAARLGNRKAALFGHEASVSKIETKALLTTAHRIGYQLAHKFIVEGKLCPESAREILRLSPEEVYRRFIHPNIENPDTAGRCFENMSELSMGWFGRYQPWKSSTGASIAHKIKSCFRPLSGLLHPFGKKGNNATVADSSREDSRIRQSELEGFLRFGHAQAVTRYLGLPPAMTVPSDNLLDNYFKNLYLERHAGSITPDVGNFIDLVGRVIIGRADLGEESKYESIIHALDAALADATEEGNPLRSLSMARGAFFPELTESWCASYDELFDSKILEACCAALLAAQIEPTPELLRTAEEIDREHRAPGQASSPSFSLEARATKAFASLHPVLRSHRVDFIRKAIEMMHVCELPEIAYVMAYDFIRHSGFETVNVVSLLDIPPDEVRSRFITNRDARARLLGWLA